MTHLLTKPWSVLVLALLLCVSLPASETPASPEVWERLVREAYIHNPELRAAHARWAAAAERPAQVGSLPDPTLGYGAFVQRMNTRQRFTFEQMIPGGGRRGLAAEDATAAAAAAAATLESAAARARAAVLMAAADWLLVHQTQAFLAADLDLTEALENVAHQRYRAGTQTQADVLRLTAEIDLLRADLAEWGDRSAPALAQLNTLLGRPGDTPPEPALAALKTLPPVPSSAEAPENETALAALLARHPELREREQRIRQAETTREVARRAQRPDFMVGLEFMDNRGPARDELMGMIAVNLPVWRERTAALRREAAAQLRAAEADQAGQRLALAADARQVLAAWRDAERRQHLYAETLVPRARQTVDLVMADYRANRAEFADLIAAQRALLALEQAALITQTDLFSRHAAWEQLAGPFTYLGPAGEIPASQ
jgi:outer membrane protein, heavy metal efflux system